MADAIGAIVAFIIVYGIPYILSKRNEQRKIDQMKREMNKRENNYYK